MTVAHSRPAVAWRGTDDGADRDPTSIVELLSDESALALFQAASTPKTVSELASDAGLSLSTAYRKVDTLEELDLVEQTNPSSGNGTPPALYVRSVDRVTVTVDDRIGVECATSDR